MISLIDVCETFWLYRQSWPKTAHYPSEATKCRRYLWYKWVGEGASNPTDATGLWKMNIGTSIHDRVQNTIQTIAQDSELSGDFGLSGCSVDVELRTGEVWVDGSDQWGGVELKYPVRGRIDLRLTEPDGTRSIHEIKSSYGRGVRAQKAETIRDDYLVQGLFYLVAGFGERVHYPIVSRDDGDRFELVVSLHELEAGYDIRVDRLYKGVVMHSHFEPYKTFVDYIKRLDDVERALADGNMPERDYRAAIKNGEIRREFTHQGVKYKSDWQCSYCEYRDRCWAAEVEENAGSHNADDFQGGEDAKAER